MPEAPLFSGILRRNWRDRTKFRYKIVIGGAQWGRYGESIGRRIRGYERVKNVGRISKIVRNTGRVLH